MTRSPVASISRAPAPAASPVPISTMVPSRTRTSASNRPSEVTTVPPLMRISWTLVAASTGLVAASVARSTAAAAAARRGWATKSSEAAIGSSVAVGRR
ncbi:hypothetical protein [Candidatus Palauibacter sp.]|uniref:hypothetical protein n=1 Tax=Candidatus Palauibacter sp. TaxID=3101350 RepID=UPI003B022F69